MTSLFLITFPDESGAASALNDLKKLQQKRCFDLVDTSLVVRSEDGEVKIKQAKTCTLGRAFWSLLFGLIFLLPSEKTSAIGSASGSLMAKLKEYGINDRLIKKTSHKLKAGSSALFLLAHNAPSKEIVKLAKDKGGNTEETHISTREEAKLTRALAW